MTPIFNLYKSPLNPAAIPDVTLTARISARRVQ